MSAVRTRHLTVRYGRMTALDQVSVDIPAGQVCGLLGVNGSGKSTLLKALLGLVRQEQGVVELLGHDHRRAREERLVGYVPQTEEIDRNFPVTVADVVLMGRYGGLGPTRRPRPSDRAAVHAALRAVGLDSLANRPIATLSGGQRQRAFMGRAIAQDARLLLLDEPFAGMDARSESTIVDSLQQLVGDGRTVLIATHDLAGVPRLCDQAVLLQRRVIAQGPVRTVLAPDTLASAFGVDPTGLST